MQTQSNFDPSKTNANAISRNKRRRDLLLYISSEKDRANKRIRRESNDEQNMKTHPNFQSLDETVQDTNAIYNYVGRAIRYQDNFKKRYTPDDVTVEYFNRNWKEFENFQVDAEKIDRLYFIENVEKEDVI